MKILREKLKCKQQEQMIFKIPDNCIYQIFYICALCQEVEWQHYNKIKGMVAFIQLWKIAWFWWQCFWSAITQANPLSRSKTLHYIPLAHYPPDGLERKPSICIKCICFGITLFSAGHFITLPPFPKEHLVRIHPSWCD